MTKREFFSYFTSPIAYVYLMTYLVLANWFFFRGFFLVGQTDVRSFFSIQPWIFLFFIPAVSMGKWAEERKQGTLEILFTLPVRDIEVVLGKFLGAFALLVTALFFTFPMVMSVAFLGNLDWGPVIGGYIGLLFMAGAYLAIGLTISSMTENQIIAFILAVVVSFLFFMLGSPLLSGARGSFVAPMFQYFGIGMHFDSIARGVIDSRDILYYLSMIAFFLFLNLNVIQTKARK